MYRHLRIPPSTQADTAGEVVGACIVITRCLKANRYILLTLTDPSYVIGTLTDPSRCPDALGEKVRKGYPCSRGCKIPSFNTRTQVQIIGEFRMNGKTQHVLGW